MRYTIILLFLLTPSTLAGQIRGRLSDASTGEPVVNAVVVSGNTKSFSGKDGSFSVPFSEFISVYAEGFQMVNFRADTLRHFVIALQPLSRRLSEVNVTAFQTPEKLKSVSGAVSLIRVSSLQDAGYNINSSLATSPGLFIQEATPGTMKLTLRGIGSRYPYGTKKIKMFFDGIPLYSAEGETYFDDISPEYISRMEILRGPASSIYGASLGGAVVLYPKVQEFGTSELSFMSSVGSYGYFKNNLTYSGSNGTNDFLVSMAEIRSNGYRQNSNYLRRSILVTYNHSIAEKVRGSLLFSGSLINSEIPSSIDSATFISDPRAAAPAWLKTKGDKKPGRILAGYKIKYQPINELEILGSLFLSFRQNEENRPFNFLDESGISYGGRFIARYIKKTGGLTYKVTAGSNLFIEIYNSSISDNPGGLGIKGALSQKGKESIFQTDLFSQLEIDLSEFTFTGGFNLNKSGFVFTDQFSNDTINQSGSYKFNAILSPRISVSWKPSKWLNCYSALNHGFTIPSLSETMTPLGLINRNIKPERAWSFETGARFGIWKDRSFIDLALYHMKVSDLIVPKRTDYDFYVGMNAGASLHEGIELAVEQWLWGNADGDTMAHSSSVINISYSVNRFRFLEFIDGENNFSGNQLPGVPENNFSGAFDIKTASGLSARVEFLSSGKIPLDDFNSRFSDRWAVLNVRGGYTVTIKRKWQCNAILCINNVTNTRYASMVVVNAPGSQALPPRYYYPGMPRWVTFSVGLKYRFLKS